MLKLPPISGHYTLDDVIVRVFTLIVKRSGGWVSKDRDPHEYRRIRLQAKLKNDEYILNFFVAEEGAHYYVGEFSSTEKDGDQGSPNWMPAEWTLRLSLKSGELWKIEKGSDVLALFEAHTKWSRLEGYLPVFTWKDNS